MEDILLSVQDLKVYFRGDETVARALEGVCLYFELRMRLREGQSLCQSTASALSASRSPL